MFASAGLYSAVQCWRANAFACVCTDSDVRVIADRVVLFWLAAHVVWLTSITIGLDGQFKVDIS